MDETERAILISALRSALMPKMFDKLTDELPELETLRHKVERLHDEIIQREAK